MEGFAFTHPHRVAIADINYGGHASNAAALHYFQEARIAYLDTAGGFSERDIGDGCGIILVEARVRYHAELFHGDEIAIGVRAASFGRTSFLLEYQAERAGEVALSGETTLVAFDYGKRRPHRVPTVLRDALTRLDGPSRGAGS